MSLEDTLLGWSNKDSIKLNYFDRCNLLCSDNNLFNNFKRDPNYTPILEHVDQSLGFEYLNIILSNYKSEHLDLVLSKLSDIKQNDIYGNPIVFNYPTFGVISPTTLRYTKVLLDLLKLGFDLNNKDIVEIGGGYGGQCLILSKFFKFKSYTILDLESVTRLQLKYLKNNNVENVYAKTINDLSDDMEFDFIISNYAFSEINKTYQDKYLEKVIYKSKSGFLQINPDADECYKHDEIKQKFNILNNKKFIDDSPMNLRYPNNFIFSFIYE